MVYGITECRRCGAPITPRGGVADAIEKQAHRIPSRVPEAVWRKQGWLAAPTLEQTREPQVGCCYTCAEWVLHRKSKRRLMILACAAAAILVIIFFAASGVPQ